VRVTENDTNLRRGRAALGQLHDLLGNLVGSGLEPCRRLARVGHRRGADTLTLGVHATHFSDLMKDWRGERVIVRQESGDVGAMGADGVVVWRWWSTAMNNCGNLVVSRAGKKFCAICGVSRD